MAVLISKLENTLLVKFSYSPERVSKIKSIKGHRWDPKRREWTIPHSDENINAIKFLYNETLNRGVKIDTIPRPKKENKLPNILSFDEVMKILDALNNEKHKALLVLVYSAGLRVGEVVRLKPEDIDSNRMLIHVVQGKGKKDRYTILSQVALKQLRRVFLI